MGKKLEPNMKELSVRISAVCSVPADFKLRPENFASFEVRFLGLAEPRIMRTRNAEVRVKDVYIEPALPFSDTSDTQPSQEANKTNEHGE